MKEPSKMTYGGMELVDELKISTNKDSNVP